MCDAGKPVGPLVTRAQEVGTVEGSLYERLGGVDAITAVARAFGERAGKDDRINQKFAPTHLDRLTKEFVDQLCQDTGGPCTYTGLSMTQAHTNMGVTNGEFDAFMEDLVAVHRAERGFRERPEECRMKNASPRRVRRGGAAWREGPAS